jgi:hypothetical protein
MSRMTQTESIYFGVRTYSYALRGNTIWDALRHEDAERRREHSTRSVERGQIQLKTMKDERVFSPLHPS